jgi:dTDP-4-dehydrorhamnose 3,5-epimerase
MIFHETKLAGAFQVDLEPLGDERGFFARSWCRREFENHGLSSVIAQCNVSFNEKKGTLRGLHYQAEPHAEAKLVRCTQGALYDVVVDIRPQSQTFRQWVGIVLSAANRHMIYIPEGFAHGFLTLEEKTEICYQMSEFYYPELSRGVRWDDPAFQIVWPGRVEVISLQDKSYPNFELR